jgi:4-amino-4-deoxy-L-arabinose transferase-like glycosyltransferase
MLLFVICIVALALRLGFLWMQQSHISHDRLATVPFEYETGNIAFALASGKGFSSPLKIDTGPTAWLTPVYPAIVALFFKLCGAYTFAAFEACALVNVLFSTLTCVPIYFAGRRVAGTRVAALAAALWAIFPAAIVIPFEWIWDTSLSALLAAIVLWATLGVADSVRRRDWCLYGLLWGFTLMTNPSLGSLLPFFLVWMVWRGRKRFAASKGTNWLRNAVLSAAVVVLACVPWTIRNYEDFHAFVPMRSALGLQLWLGNNPYYIHEWGAWLHPIDNPNERAKYIEDGEIAYMDEKLHLGLHYIWIFPRHAAELARQKFVATWLGTAHPLRDFSRARVFLELAVDASNILISLGVLVGIVVLVVRRNPYAFPLIVVPIVYPCLYYLTVALLRYRHPIDPILILISAIAVSAVLPKRWLAAAAAPNSHATLAAA